MRLLFHTICVLCLISCFLVTYAKGPQKNKSNVPDCGSIDGRTKIGLKAALKRWSSGESDKNSEKGGHGHGNDGIVFQNRGEQLPVLSPNSYTEWGLNSKRGTDPDNRQRVVISKAGDIFLTFDHYATFCSTKKAKSWKPY